MNTASFVYDGMGRVVKRTLNGAATVIAYDGWKPTVEWDGTGGFLAWNVYGPGADEILHRYQSGVGHLRYHHDQHGNVRYLLDWDGNRLEKYTYDAFGKPTVVSWTGSAWNEAAPRDDSMLGQPVYLHGAGMDSGARHLRLPPPLLSAGPRPLPAGRSDRLRGRRHESLPLLRR